MPHVVAALAVGMLVDRVRARRRFYGAAVAAYGGALLLCALLIG